MMAVKTKEKKYPAETLVTAKALEKFYYAMSKEGIDLGDFIAIAKPEARREAFARGWKVTLGR